MVFHWNPRSTKQDQGFALLEVIVALAIMALVGLMAWRGMDAMIRGREVIDRRATQDSEYSQVVLQFERDCQEVLRRDELNALAASIGTPGLASGISSVVAGAKNIWFIRRYRVDNQDAWLIAGYGIGPNGLQRWTSRPLLQRADAGTLWSGLMRDPDLASTDLLVSLEVPVIIRQAFQLQTAAISGAGSGGTSASGTGSALPAGAPGSNAGSTTSTSSGTSNSGNTGAGAVTVSTLLPQQQGVVMQWWMKDVTLPITRSCLMGGAL